MCAKQDDQMQSSAAVVNSTSRARVLGVLLPACGFAALMILLVLAFAWTLSKPGTGFFGSYLVLGSVLLVPALLIAVVVFGLALPRGHRLLGVAPIVVAIGATALWAVTWVTQWPLDVRFAASESDFQAVVEQIDPAAAQHVVADGWGDPVAVPKRIGTYEISNASVVHGGVIFYEAHGNFFDDAGFAYLPQGPTDDLANGGFESPQWQHLRGPWYSWTASW